jgi:hypothetical protein
MASSIDELKGGVLLFPAVLSALDAAFACASCHFACPHPHECKLCPVLKATLAKSGALGNMKAQMRAEIFRALECDSVGAAHAFCASELCRPAVMVRRLPSSAGGTQTLAAKRSIFDK